jgi:cellobiose phosphorylase
MYDMDEKDGRILLKSPRQLGDYANYLLNDTYHVKVSETLQGASKVLRPMFRPRNILAGFKQFYLRFPDGYVWNVNQDLKPERMATYELVHDLHETTLYTSLRGLDVVIRVFVLPRTMAEVWEITLTNQTQQAMDIALFSAFDLENAGVMEGKACYDPTLDGIISHTFPYHVSYDEKNFLERSIPSYVVVYPTKKARSYECSLETFYGTNVRAGIDPRSVVLNRCSNQGETGPKTAAVFHHEWNLASKDSKRMSIVIGAFHSEKAIKETRAGWNEVQLAEKYRETASFWKAQKEALSIETPHRSFDHMINGWFKKQLYNMSVNQRMSAHYPIRNVLQDAMGYALFDPAFAYDTLVRILETQHQDGSIWQWQHEKGTGPNGLGRLHHSDGPIWLVLTGLSILEQNGTSGLLEESVPYQDQGTDTIQGHFIKAIESMGDNVGEHGLCLMLDGDWTDPINGVGRHQKGESTWNTLATIHVIERFLPYVSDEADRAKLETISKRLAASIRKHAFRDDYLCAGFDDEGKPFGDASNRYGKTFLNVHTWALMTTIFSKEEKERIEQRIEALQTPIGPVLLAPAYETYDEQVGRISLKKPGTTENGSIYNHAVLFKAYAEALNGKTKRAFQTILDVLPDNPKNPNRDWQLPIYMPNYYFGGIESPQFGRSSRHNSTGTTAWIYTVFVEYVLGIRATFHGLVVSDVASLGFDLRFKRKYLEATYVFEIVCGQRFNVNLDGKTLRDGHLPYEANRTYHIKIERRKDDVDTKNDGK